MNNIGRNIGMTVEDKWKFLKPYKFTISFENEEAPYYTSEKVFEAMKMNSIPIYWGNPEIGLDFNTNSFINWYDYGSDESVIEHVKEIDQNQELYSEMLNQPFFHDNRLNEYVDRDNIINQLEYIFKTKIAPVSSSSSLFSDNTLIRKTAAFGEEFNYYFSLFFTKLRKFNLNRLKIKFHKIRHGQKF